MLERGETPVRVPALLLALATGLWGWHQDVLVHALAAAIAIEVARIVPFRWDFDDRDFHRLGDVTGVGLLLLVLVQFTDRGLVGIYGVLRWVPLAMLALLLAQRYSTRRAIPLSAVFLSVRFALSRGRIRQPGDLDMQLPYLVACLLSACAGPWRSAWVVPLSAALLAWLLWANRPREQRLGMGVAALALCLGIAVLGKEGVDAARRALTPIIMDIVRERIAHWRDPFRSHTALGEIGRLKVSDRIVLRVTAPPGTREPALLHEARYTLLSNNVWLAGASRFDALEPGADGTRWDLAPGQRPFRLVNVDKSLIRNKGILAVPGGAFRIDDLPVEELEASPLGALKVLNGPALVSYRVRYADGAGFTGPPTPEDLVVPQRLESALARTLYDLAIVPGSDPEAVVAGLWRHFNENFRYSLNLGRGASELHPVEDFLTVTRSGHCEYFATATVLLLRAAGVSARYATGYSVQEFSPLEDAWVVRRRHAHSWASAWVDGRWVDVDTTPASWVAAEAAGAAWWQPGYDLVSYLLHRLASWRLRRTGEEESDTDLLWLLLPLGLFLAWRIYRSRRVGRPDRAPRPRPAQPRAWPGADSDFYRLESFLAERGLVRPASRPPRAWLDKLARDGQLPASAQGWEEIVALHYRLRFAPRGLDDGQRGQLARAVQRWLDRSMSVPEADPRRREGN
jgi:transglutaminase-like putative cysteine protease